MNKSSLINIKFYKVIKVMGMKRSGQHAIIDWIIQNTEYNLYVANNILVEDSVTFHDRGSDKNVLIYNIEDYDETKHGEMSLGSQCNNHLNLLIIRDPLNLFASRIKVSSKNNYQHWYNEYAIKLYNQHIELSKNIKTIDYNQWVLDNEYKLKLSKFLGLNTCNDNNEVSSLVGSSFTGKSIKLIKEDLLCRWKTLNKNQLDYIRKNIDLEPFKNIYDEIII